MKWYFWFPYFGIIVFYIINVWDSRRAIISNNIKLKIAYYALGIISFAGMLLSLGNLWVALFFFLIVAGTFVKVIFFD